MMKSLMMLFCLRSQMMKSTMMFFCFWLLLVCCPYSAKGDLLNQTLSGDEVVYDDVSNQYWYYNLRYFSLLTFEEQEIKAAELNSGPDPYGGFNNWHLADTTEMEGLWSYDSEVIAGAFAPTFGENKYGYYADWEGRYNSDSLVVSDHYWALISAHVGYYYYKSPIETYCNGSDDWRYAATGAWVTTYNVVPVPSAALLGALGLSFAGMKLHRRKE